MSGNAKYKAEVVIGITENNDAVFYDIVDMEPTIFDIKETEASPTVTTQNAIDDTYETSVSDILPQNSKKSSGNVDFSISEDTQGRKLSAEQQEYFKDSKVVDTNGNLKVMYHGSPETFTVFDRKKAKSFGTYGNGFYFTDSISHAGTYGEKPLTVYLNITNPLQNGTNNITKEQLRKFVEAIAENEDYGIENYGYDATVESVVDSVYGKGDFGIILDINISCVGNMAEAIELFNEVNGTNYDGIIAPTETVAFYPNQIKSIDNQNPTDNPDIRFSISEESLENIGKILYNDNNPLAIVNRAKSNNNSSIKWVYNAEIFSVTENILFHEKISEINQGSRAFQKTTNDEYMLQIENKIVFTDGNYEAPYISEIIEVLTDSQTEFEAIKERIFDVEKGKSSKQDAVRYVQNVYGKGCVITYTSGNDGVYEWEDGRRKGKTRRAVVKNYLNKHYGRRNVSQINETKADLNGSAFLSGDANFSLSEQGENIAPIGN